MLYANGTTVWIRETYVCPYVGSLGRFNQVVEIAFAFRSPFRFIHTAEVCVYRAHVRMIHRPTDSIYILKAFLLAILMLPVTLVTVNGLPIFENEHVSTSKSLPMLHTSETSENSPLTMKKPCTLYLVERDKLLSETTEVSDGEETSWVCELHAEDRVRVTSLRLVHTLKLLIHTVVLFLLITYGNTVYPL
jgi:hypothetical protein